MNTREQIAKIVDDILASKMAHYTVRESAIDRISKLCAPDLSALLTPLTDEEMKPLLKKHQIQWVYLSAFRNFGKTVSQATCDAIKKRWEKGSTNDLGK